MPVRTSIPLLAGVWLAGVAVATGVGLLGVRLVADQVGEPSVPVLDADGVSDALASAPSSAPVTALPSRTPAPATRSTPAAPAGPVRSFSSQGGTVGVRCSGTTPIRVFAAPAQGYRIDESSVEGWVLEVRFESGRTRVRIEVSCATRSPVLIERRVDTSGKG